MDALMNAAPTMSSREIADLVEVRHDSVKRTIERLAQKGVIGLPPLVEYLDSLGRKASEYRVGKRDSYVIVAQLSPEFTARLVDRWQELESGAVPQRQLTTAEQFLAMAQITVDLEKKQNEHSAAIIAMGERVHQIEAKQSVMSSCPQAAEPITRIRVRMHATYGISAATVDAVMRQSPYAPKPAGMVKNTHESANESTYAVYWKKDITATFRRFASECSQATATQCTHPFIEGRFKMTKKEAA